MLQFGMHLKFTKMHGQGNDFVMLNGITQAVHLSPAQIRAIADRHFGVGCDQLLMVEKTQRTDADFRYRIFNADGGEVSQCGNGARCFVRFVREEGLASKPKIRVETLSGVIEPRIDADGTITVDMSAPRFSPAYIPFLVDTEALSYSLDLNGKSIDIAALSMGNPHAVQVVENTEMAPVAELGPLIENHPRFPARVNAGFMQIVSRTQIRLRVWERGAGETLACGTGACAAVVAGIRWGRLDNDVRVLTRGGELTVCWLGGANPVLLSGTATVVYKGEIEI